MDGFSTEQLRAIHHWLLGAERTIHVWLVNFLWPFVAIEWLFAAVLYLVFWNILTAFERRSP